ncbi:ABC transporter substrate-binding protein [Zafaria sp. Z1313]|uniref:ABC transporter substrate-binding protein n=1 Tax=unclassified Zafaria TaxID=2828765 RepID=UPI002E77187F|nr:ABC transporter substrate-binding protein [Zafaria sp. J156]MEE1620628.1 ABC transporter substrate-binding protein [Zafaria sp. J156]
MSTIRYTPDDGDRRTSRRAFLAAGGSAIGLLVLGAAATTTIPRPGGAVATAAGPAERLRLGFFANLTHAPALVGTGDGIFAEVLGAQGTTIEEHVFNAGPAAVEALNAGAIDAAYLGPNPAISAYVSSAGTGIRILAGAAAGGAQLVVRRGLDSPEALRGATLGTPQLGGTQDVALRTWLTENGLDVDVRGGAVSITPTGNAQTFELFRSGQLDGAWLPEPWASRLVLEADAVVLVDEAELWDGSETGQAGLFPTTVLAVGQEFAARHPETVESLVAAHVRALTWINGTSRGELLPILDRRLTETAGAGLDDAVMERALDHLTFTSDPLSGAFPRLLQAGVDAGVTEPGDLTGLVDESVLRSVLERGVGA